MNNNPAIYKKAINGLVKPRNWTHWLQLQSYTYLTGMFPTKFHGRHTRIAPISYRALGAAKPKVDSVLYDEHIMSRTHGRDATYSVLPYFTYLGHNSE